MKRNFIILVLIIISATSYGQLVWKISGNGLKKTSYIFASHPLIPVIYLDSVPGLYKAFNECGTVISEINLNTIDATNRLQQAATIPGKKYMSDYLSKDTFDLVDKELRDNLKIGLKEMSAMRPELILEFYKQELFKQLTGISDDAQSDSYFQQIAEEKGKKVIGLESIESYVKSLIANRSVQSEAKILAQRVMHKDELSKELLSINNLYRKGKINDLYLLSVKDRYTANSENDYNSKQVADWIKQLPAIIYNKSCFITLDVKYIAGPEGLIERLQKMGFKVRPVE
jgi:uncharacterized protein YbaP (TraB family)